MWPLLLCIVIIGYIGFGIALIRLSMFLAKRIQFPALRIAIHTAVFTFWFMPGLAANEGGAMPAPMWLVVLDMIHRGYGPVWVMVFKMAGACWGIVWIFCCGLDLVFRRGEKIRAARGTDRYRQ